MNSIKLYIIPFFDLILFKPSKIHFNCIMIRKFWIIGRTFIHFTRLHIKYF